MPGFTSPEWLLLLPALAIAGRAFRRPCLHQPLRALGLVLLVLALAKPRLTDRPGAMDLFVLADRSLSARDRVVPRLEEMETLLEESRPPRDRLFFIDFAEGARLRLGAEAETRDGLGETTRIGNALSFALSSREPDRGARLLLLSDGQSTEPLDGILERLERESVPLDLRLLPPPEGRDVAVERIEMPARGKPGEPFPIEVRLRAEEDGEVSFAISRNGRPRGTAKAVLRDGWAVARLSDRLPPLPEAGGALRYDVRLEGEDVVPGNDTGTAWIGIESGPRIVLVTAYADDPLVPVLSSQGFRLETLTEPGSLTLGHLSGARALVLNNVPATHLPADLLEALDSWVRFQGGGLLMAGGEYSFGAGGYFQSPLDLLLPVSMELREEHRMLSVAMAIVMDRSGSMAAGVSGGRTKMDLANEGAARSVELLGPLDAVAVFAVDSSAHAVVPLTPLRNGSASIVDSIRRIESGGGGIFVYEGLSAAWKELRASPLGQRHVILFADAADSEEPGDYRRLLQEMTEGGATVSVIGLGSPEDTDAPLLREIAERGKGRVFFNADAETLPALFAQETVAVARSAFLDEPVGVEPGVEWLEIASKPLQGLDAVDGYNLSYLREEATGAAFSADEYEAPLVAFWNRGSGRVASVSFPLGGAYSARARAWPGYGDFAQTLARWLMGEDVPPGIGLLPRLEGTVLRLDLWFDESWEERLSRTPPEAFLLGGGGEVETLVWERLEPGRFRTERGLSTGEVYRGAVRVGATVLPFGPLTATGSAEWSRDRRRVLELQAISRASGGVERTELASIWSDRAFLRSGELDLTPILLWCFLLVFLLDALSSRAGWRLPEMSLWRRAPLPAAAALPVEAPRPEPVVEAEPLSPPGERRRARFARAKDGR